MSITTIPADQYHRDEVADQPTLSKSVMHILLEQSPAHARAKHPKLATGPVKRVEKDVYDIGNAVHQMLLEGRSAVMAIDADNFRTNAAKEARDLARAENKIPLLVDKLAEVEAMVDAIKAQLASFDCQPPLLAAGKPEQTIVWTDQGVLCRARIDWLHNDMSAIDDLKTASRSGNPHVWTKTMYGMGGDLQARFYARGVKALTGREPEFRFIVLETEPPYEVSVVSLAPSAVALADDMIDDALATWKRCLETGKWPGYPRRVCYVEAPGWAEAQWLSREAVAA